MNNSFRIRIESERVFVRDDDGYVEADHDLVFCNPDLYTWENAVLDNGVMIYFFRFNG